MHETFQLASLFYKEFMDNAPSVELCNCVTNDEVNGVMEELASIAEQLRVKQSNGGKARIRCFSYAGGYSPCGFGGGMETIQLAKRRKRSLNNDYESLQQAYLENSNKETAFDLISLGKWTPGTLKGRKQWVNYAAMLTYSMINEQEIKNFATFLFCKLSA